MSRPWWAGAERHRLGDSIQRLAPKAAVIRLHPDGSVEAYRTDRTIIHGRQKTHDERIGELLRAYYAAIDWTAPHDFYIGDGRLCTAPQRGEPGCWPSLDGTFGSAPGPTYLPKTPKVGAP